MKHRLALQINSEQSLCFLSKACAFLSKACANRFKLQVLCGLGNVYLDSIKSRDASVVVEVRLFETAFNDLTPRLIALVANSTTERPRILTQCAVQTRLSL